MKKDYDEIFQDRIDELYVLEERIGRRSDKFIQTIEAYQRANRAEMNTMAKQLGHVHQTLSTLKEASETAQESIEKSQALISQSWKILGFSMVLSIGFVSIAFAYVHYLV